MSSSGATEFLARLKALQQRSCSKYLCVDSLGFEAQIAPDALAAEHPSKTTGISAGRGENISRFRHCRLFLSSR